MKVRIKDWLLKKQQPEIYLSLEHIKELSGTVQEVDYSIYDDNIVVLSKYTYKKIRHPFHVSINDIEIINRQIDRPIVNPQDIDKKINEINKDRKK